MGAASMMSGRSNMLGSPKATRCQPFAFCRCCQRHFSISHAGINDVKKHENTDLHKRSIQFKPSDHMLRLAKSATAGYNQSLSAV